MQAVSGFPALVVNSCCFQLVSFRILGSTTAVTNLFSKYVHVGVLS